MKIWVLLNKSGDTVVPGATLETFRGEQVILTGGKPPQHPGSTGRVYVKFADTKCEAEMFPSVVDLTWTYV